ncbi:hypothetical protein ACFL6S_22810, partial [Candidatus Poribacteria bacterium]
ASIHADLIGFQQVLKTGLVQIISTLLAIVSTWSTLVMRHHGKVCAGELLKTDHEMAGQTLSTVFDCQLIATFRIARNTEIQSDITSL